MPGEDRRQRGWSGSTGVETEPRRDYTGGEVFGAPCKGATGAGASTAGSPATA